MMMKVIMMMMCSWYIGCATCNTQQAKMMW